MKSWQYLLIGAAAVALLVIGFVITYRCGVSAGIREAEQAPPKEVSVTDTHYIYSPVPVDRCIVKKEIIEIHDTVTVRDTLYAVLDREQAYYHKDSLYDIWVSGIAPALDSVSIFTTTTYIDRVVTHKVRRKFTYGVQLGIGCQYGLIRQTFDVGPYLGIGIGYNF